MSLGGLHLDDLVLAGVDELAAELTLAYDHDPELFERSLEQAREHR